MFYSEKLSQKIIVLLTGLEPWVFGSRVQCTSTMAYLTISKVRYDLYPLSHPVTIDTNEATDLFETDFGTSGWRDVNNTLCDLSRTQL